jgi:hypothetical protein
MDLSFGLALPQDGSAKDSGGRQLLEAQVITDQAITHYQQKDVERFVDIREKDLNAMEDAKFKEVTKNLFPSLR